MQRACQYISLGHWHLFGASLVALAAPISLERAAAVAAAIALESPSKSAKVSPLWTGTTVAAPGGGSSSMLVLKRFKPPVSMCVWLSSGARAPRSSVPLLSVFDPNCRP